MNISIYTRLSLTTPQFTETMKRKNFKQQQDKDIVSSSEDSDSNMENSRQVLFRSRSRSSTPVIPEVERRRSSTSRGRRHGDETYRPSIPSYPPTPPPYVPQPPSYDEVQRVPRYRDGTYRVPRYDSWSHEYPNGAVRKRSVQNHTVRASSIICLGEKRPRREEGMRSREGEGERRVRSREGEGERRVRSQEGEEKKGGSLHLSILAKKEEKRLRNQGEKEKKLRVKSREEKKEKDRNKSPRRLVRRSLTPTPGPSREVQDRSLSPVPGPSHREVPATAPVPEPIPGPSHREVPAPAPPLPTTAPVPEPVPGSSHKEVPAPAPPLPTTAAVPEPVQGPSHREAPAPASMPTLPTQMPNPMPTSTLVPTNPVPAVATTLPMTLYQNYQHMPQPSSGYIPQLFQPYQFPGEQGPPNLYNYHPQNHALQNGIVMDTLRIIREIMVYGNNQVPPIQHLRSIKRERLEQTRERSDPTPAEIITLEEPENKKSPEDDSSKEEEGKEEKKIEGNDQEEESGHAEVNKPPTKERIKNMIKIVKNDEKAKNKKPNQSQRK